MYNKKNGYAIISQQLIHATTAQARTSPRQRMNHNFHELADTVQRMLNAVEPDSYCRPHRHIDPPKDETFVLLQGDLTVVIFDDSGNIVDAVRLNDRTGNKGIDIKPGVWHTIVSNASGTVIFETKTGPYIPASDKDFAPWAPAEGEPQASTYLQGLLDRIRDFRP